MCNSDDAPLAEWVKQASEGSVALVTGSAAPAASGTRRRRLWELEAHAHCPLIGVGLSMPVLRRLADKVLGGQALASDHDLHCGVVGACQSRTSMAEAVHKEMEHRYSLSVRQAARQKSEAALKAWWTQSSTHQLAGALWAVLTHARCSPALAKEVLGQVHMIQHQVGAACRLDMARFESLMEENAVLTRSLAAAQGRHSQLMDAHNRRLEQQQALIVQLRAELIGRDTAIAAVRDELLALESAIPGLQARVALTRQCQRHIDRLHQLERALLQARQEAEHHKGRADALAQDLLGRDLQASPQVKAEDVDPQAVPDLGDRAVLCVGGRRSIVPIYRQLIERAGGRFLHHDGGVHESVARLDATLATADLVICQTGCISHDAYWRVKDHCKRTGKRCVFVENPSASSLVRGLEQAAIHDVKDVTHGAG